MPEEPALADLASEVEAIREQLVVVARKHPEQWWTARELAAQPEAGDRAGTVVMIALNGLIKDKTFEADSRWRVRLAT